MGSFGLEKRNRVGGLESSEVEGAERKRHFWHGRLNGFVHPLVECLFAVWGSAAWPIAST